MRGSDATRHKPASTRERSLAPQIVAATPAFQRTRPLVSFRYLATLVRMGRTVCNRAGAMHAGRMNVLFPLPDRDFDVTEVAVPWLVLARAGHTGG